MSDRHEQARAEAERTYGHAPLGPMRSGLEAGFSHGMQWADANPQPTTITRAELGAAADEFTEAGATGEWVSIEDMLIEALSSLGIEVTRR